MAAQPPRPQTWGEQRDLRDAEELIIRAMSQFGTTLDFATVFGTMYVKDRAMRRLTIEAGLTEMLTEDHLQSFDTPILERAFMASQTDEWLYWVYFYSESNDERKTRLDFDVFQTAIRPRVMSRLNRRQKTLYKKLWSEKDSNSSKAATSEAELFDLTAIHNAIAKVVRSQFGSQLRKILKDRVSAHADTESPEILFGSYTKYRNVIDVEARIKGVWGKWRFTVVKELGQMKILRVWIADGPG